MIILRVPSPSRICATLSPGSQNRKLSAPGRVIIATLAIMFCSTAASGQAGNAPNLQPKNPFIADSPWPMVHADPAQSDVSPMTGPTGPTRRVNDDELQWVPLGPVNAWETQYSGPYPDGRHVIWSGGSDRVVKIDADSLEVISTLATSAEKFYSEREINQYVTKLDALTGQAMYDHSFEMWLPLLYRVSSFYRLIDSNNDAYMLYSLDRSNQFVRVYGDAVPGDADSDIVLKRQWKFPEALTEHGNALSLNMTHDGWLAVVTSDGKVIVLNRELTEYHTIQIPGSETAAEATETAGAFVRNGIAIDDQGGIYVVTSAHLNRIQWTGKKLSLDPADGAWSVPYANEVGNGSGTTPALLGWGDDEDHLIMIADGSLKVNMVAYWRDEIPADWEGIPGQPRRLAGIVPLSFGVEGEDAQTEVSPITYGYGAFIGNNKPSIAVPNQKSFSRQMVAEMHSFSQPGYTPIGGMKTEWNPRTRTLEPAWISREFSTTSTVCSLANGGTIIYCIGHRDEDFTLEGIDWATGKSVFHWKLGKSQRYNSWGGSVKIAPNGAVDCACAAGLGMVRIVPRE